MRRPGPGPVPLRLRPAGARAAARYHGDNCGHHWPEGTTMSAQVDDCLEACLECHRICLETVSHLSTGDDQVAAEDIRLLFNTADVCRTNASLLRGGADRHRGASVACAELCEQSARYCDGRGDDPRLRACAVACRRCAAACRGLAALAA